MEAHVVRLGSRMGVLEGVARVDGKIIAGGTMTCALGPAQPQTHAG
jgi:acyl-coenzyme A thioesterase PaaI-like protein